MCGITFYKTVIFTLIAENLKSHVNFYISSLLMCNAQVMNNIHGLYWFIKLLAWYSSLLSFSLDLVKGDVT